MGWVQNRKKAHESFIRGNSDMSKEIQYNPKNEKPAYKQFRLTVSNDVLVSAIEEKQRRTGQNERELAKEALVSYLEQENLIQLE